MDASVLYAGIFACENGQRFLQILMQFTDRAFIGLFERANGRITSSFYQTGLKRVSTWSNSLLQEDVKFVKKRNSDIDETYESCFMQYVEDRFGKKQKTIAKCPEFIDFIRSFLEHMSQQAILINGEYFSREDPIKQRISIMDATRSSFSLFTTPRNVKVDLLSEVGTQTPYKGKNSVVSEPASYVTKANSKVYKTIGNDEQNIVLDEETSIENKIQDTRRPEEENRNEQEKHEREEKEREEKKREREKERERERERGN